MLNQCPPMENEVTTKSRSGRNGREAQEKAEIGFPDPLKSVVGWYSFLLKFRRRCFARLENTDFSFFPHRIQGRNISSLGLRRASDNQTDMFPSMQVIVKDVLS